MLPLRPLLICLLSRVFVVLSLAAVCSAPAHDTLAHPTHEAPRPVTTLAHADTLDTRPVGPEDPVQRIKNLQRSVNGLFPSSPDSALQLLERIRTELDQLDGASDATSDSLLGMNEYLIGRANYYRGYHMLSNSAYMRAMDTERARNDDRFTGNLWNNIGINHYILGDPEQAIEALLRSLEVDMRYGDSLGVAYSRINLSLLFLQVNSQEEAVRNLRLAEAVFLDADDRTGLALVNHNLFRAMERVGDVTQARDHLQRALRFYRETGQEYDLSSLLGTAATFESNAGNILEAEEHITEATQLAERNGYTLLLDQLHITNAELLIDRGRIGEARRLLDQVDPETPNHMVTHQALQLAVNREMFDARDFRRQVDNLLVLRDSLQDAMREEKLQELRVQYETERALQEVSFQKQVIRQQSRSLWFIAIGSLLLVAALVQVAISRNSLKESFNELYKRNEELRTFYRVFGVDALTAKSSYLSSSSSSSSSSTGPTGASPEADPHLDAVNEALPDGILPESPHPEPSRQSALWSAIVDQMVNKRIWKDPSFNQGQLAAACASNRTYVSREIREVTGLHFNAFVNRFRIEHAKNLLVETDDTISQVADRSGFNSSSTFFNAFRELTGLTPLQYRKQQDQARLTRPAADDGEA